MDSAAVDEFSRRLGAELSALPWEQRNELLVRIGRMELRMRASGQERSAWRGPVPEDRILGADVVVPTEQGERRGRVICFGVVSTGPEYERSVIVHVPSSGTQHEAPGSLVRLADPGDVARIASEAEMAARLRSAQAVAEARSRPARRGVRDPELVQGMLDLAQAHPRVRSVERGASNSKVTGADPTRRMYVFSLQLRVDLSGFTLDHPGVRRVSEQEARDMHLGKVRGQLVFDDRAVALAAFAAALEHL